MSCGKSCNCYSYREHLLSVRISSQATPNRNRSAETVAAVAREKRWAKDMPAYKRLRADGLQPRHIDGSASFEAKARDRIEIEDGRNYGKDLSYFKDVKAVRESV